MPYLARRAGFYLAALWAAGTLNFGLPRLMPGNPAEAIYAAHYQQLQADPNALHELEVSLGVSKAPLLDQYWHYLVDLCHGNFGLSFSYFPVPVSKVILQSMPWTIGLMGVAAIISFVLGTFIGILAAWRRGSLYDSVLPPLALMIGAFPAFFMALLLLYFAAALAGWFPLGHAYTPGAVVGFTPHFVLDVVYHAVLPALTVVLFSVGGWVLGMRNTMINVLAEDYVTMAEARGLSDRRVMLSYAARNALLPQLTGLSLSLGFLIGGQILVEDIYSYPGLGSLLANAIGSEDYPLIQALLLTITVSVLIANLVMDVLYARLDPRTRISR
jgi:peptide/nickel transport system permease protein